MKNLHKSVNYERISLLYQSAPMAIIGLVISFLALFFTVKDLLPLNYLVYWSIAFTAIFLWRLSLYLSFKYKIYTEIIDNSNIQRWEYHWIIMTIFTASIFSSLIFFPFTHRTVTTMLTISMVFMAMSAGSVVSSNASKSVVIAFLTLTSIPLISKAIYEGPEYYILAIVYSFLYPILVKLTLNGNHVVVENIRLKKQSEQDSLKDQLTGLWNRRSLELFIEKLLAKSQRHKHVFSVLMLDIDFFKQFNDTYGHLKGDEALIQTANCLIKDARETDLVSRFGGEEFLIILPETDLEEAKSIAERIISLVRTETNMTISAGIAQFLPGMTFDELIKKADDALYLAKKNGRDRVEGLQ